MFWAGGLIGAIFGLAGIFAAACLYLFYALIKLVFLLAAFAAQLIFAISGLIARAIIYTYHRFSQGTPAATPAKTARSPRATARKSKAIPDGLKPKRKRRSAAR